MYFERQRTTGSLSPISCNSTTVYCSGTSASKVINSPFAEGDETRMWDVVTPHFRKRSAAGEVIINGMRRERRVQTCTGSGIRMGLITCPVPPGSAISYSDYDRFLPLVAIDPASPPNDSRGYGILNTYLNLDTAITAAATQAMAKVGSSPINGLAILGEGGKTLQTLRNPVSAITQYLGKGRFTKRSFAEMSADQFLQVYYGIKPFMNDVEEIVRQIRQLNAVHPERSTARGIFSTQNTEYLGTRRYQGTSWYIDVRREMEESFTYRRGILYQDEASLGGKFGLRLSEVPAALLELSPYSFVVDWFVNLQSFISAITPVAKVTPLGAWESWSFHQVVKHMVVGSGVPPAYASMYRNMRPCSDVYNQTYIASGRNAKAYGTDVGLAFRPKFSLTKLAVATSLAIQQLKGVKFSGR